MAGLVQFLRGDKSQRGQMILAFIILFPVFIICLFIVTDMGRYLALKNQVRIVADSAALAAAGALDLREATMNENFVINKNWARKRAMEAIDQTMQIEPEENKWMKYWLQKIIVKGDRVTVVVEGTGTFMFGGYLGLSSFNARSVSHARVAVGVEREW
jgi:Flp pilus assembly protein TadG